MDSLARLEADQTFLVSRQKQQRVVVIVPQYYSEDWEVAPNICYEVAPWHFHMWVVILMVGIFACHWILVT